MKTLTPTSSMGEDATDVDKQVFKVEVSEYINHCNRLWDNL